MSTNHSTVPIKRSIGRPTLYNDRLAERICTLVRNGYSIRKITSRRYFPAEKTFYLWLQKYPEFLQQYTQARQDRTEYMLDELLEIADGTQEDTLIQINRDKLKLDTRKWAMARLSGKYSDKSSVDMKVSGKVDHAHIHTHHVNIPMRMSVNDWLEHKRSQNNTIYVDNNNTTPLLPSHPSEVPKDE